MIKTGGENVHAAEVECVLLSHPAVAAAAAFGLDHSRLGEQVAAAVLLQPGWAWGGAAGVAPQQQGNVSGATAPQQQQQRQGTDPVGSGFKGVVSAADLQQHCRSVLLSPYKLPRVLVCVQQLPLNSSGKVVKAVLKQQVQQLLAAGLAGGTASQQSVRSKL
jgi:acyl-CoA synthetase (AMP-forming)/AMP-acid ligase II